MSQSTFSKVFRKSFSIGEPEETPPGTKETRPASKPAPRARALPPVRVLYVTGETREITFVTGTFDKVYPHLVLDFPVSLSAVRPLLEGEARHEAVVVGWSVPEVEALSLITALRERQPHMPIVAVGERSPDMSLAAGADEFVQRDATMLTRLPVAIEESVRRQQERAALAPPVQEPPAPLAPGDSEATAPSLPHAAVAPSEDLSGLPAFSSFPEETTGRAAMPRMALIGDLDRAREAVAAEAVALELVPISAVAEGAKCAAVVIDQSHLSVDTTEALRAALDVSLPTILLYDPQAAESVIRAFAGDADEMIAKETGWAQQVVLRLNLAVARHRRTLELASLKARESRLRATVESLPAAVVRLSPEGTILAANTVAVSLLGGDESRQLLRKQFYSLVNPPDRDQCIEGIGRAYAGEKRSIEVWATTFSGESRALQLNAAPFAADGGAPASVLTVLRDITDRKRLEMALELASAAPPAAAPTPIAAPVADLPAAPPVLSRDSVALAPDAEALRALESQLQRMSKQARDSFEQLEASLRDAESHHEAVAARHREEQAMFESAQVERWRSYDAFVHGAAHPILHAASDGTLLAANPAFLTMLGADSAEALLARAASLNDITPADQWQAAVERWRDADQSSAPVESRWKRADGTVLALLLHGRRIGGQTKADERLEVIVENVTGRRALEFQLKRARRWEDVAKVTTGIAGDLQHAVAALGTSAERIAELPADPASQAALADVRQQATHAASLSRQLVAFGRRESREPEPMDLNDLVRGLEGVLRRMADEHVELAFEFGSRVGPVQADRSTVGEALVALTLAAAAALPAGGTLVVRTTSQEIASRATAPDGVEPGSYAVLTIAAAGWGLTGVEAEVGGGSVAAIAQAVERSGGHLTTTVTPGQSVEFAVYLALTAEVVEV